MARVKASRLAGRWYASGATALREQVDGLLRAAGNPAVGAAPVGLVVPHAGYEYSGRAAAVGYAALNGVSCQRAVILAPSHFHSFRGVALLEVDGFTTPLGQVQVDTDAVAMLARLPLVRVDAGPYQEEHSLEIQLPFLQRVLPAVRVVPILFGNLNDADYAVVASALQTLGDADTIFIVSSDFAHYGWRFDYLPFPADGPKRVREGLRTLDMGAIERVCAGDAPAFRQYVAETGATICGRIPIAAFLTLHRRRTLGQLLTYYTSLDVTQDYEHSVSYAAIAFPRPAGATDQ